MTTSAQDRALPDPSLLRRSWWKVSLLRRSWWQARDRGWPIPMDGPRIIIDDSINLSTGESPVSSGCGSAGTLRCPLLRPFSQVRFDPVLDQLCRRQWAPCRVFAGVGEDLQMGVPPVRL